MTYSRFLLVVYFKQALLTQETKTHATSSNGMCTEEECGGYCNGIYARECRGIWTVGLRKMVVLDERQLQQQKIVDSLR